MYTVIIVDDEKLVISSLKSSINWNEYGFEIIGQAEDGMEAYEIIKKLNPHLVFTDIRMPEMSGLDLMKKVKQDSINTQFIVISGYAEFAYAQKAMNYGAIGYCLKPFEDEELISLLEKAKKVLNQLESSFEMDVLSLLEDKNINSKKKLKQLLEQRGFNFDRTENLTVAASIGSKKMDLGDENECLTIKAGKNKYVYIVKCEKNALSKEFLKKSITADILGVCICRLPVSIDSLEEVVENAFIGAYIFFMKGTGEVYEINNLKGEDESRLIRRLELAAGKKDIASTKNIMDKIEEAFNGEAYTIKHALRVHNIVMSLLYRLNGQQYEDYLYNYDKLTGLFSNVNEMMKYLKNLINDCFVNKQEVAIEDIKNETFRNILQHVNDNFCTDISLQDISRQFIINSSYVSQMFKKELGVTFIEYITRLRINYAEMLLKTTELTIAEVAEKSGYEDYFYFNKIFKKSTGKTPNQYRQ